MKTDLFESKTFLGKPVTVLAASEAPLRGFIFPVEFEGSWKSGIGEPVL